MAIDEPEMPRAARSLSPCSGCSPRLPLGALALGGRSGGNKLAKGSVHRTGLRLAGAAETAHPAAGDDQYRRRATQPHGELGQQTADAVQ